jgi:tetratricopeptide (TPR) repeat protein
MQITLKGISLSRPLVVIALASLSLNSFLVAGKLPQAEELYARAHYQESVALLDEHTTDPATLFLIGRDYYMLSNFKKAAEYLQRAVEAKSQSSEYIDWLGRAYGKRAEISNPLRAATLAAKARKAFERAVELDSHNVEALSDLFDYYFNAPGVLGGGFDKADRVAEKMLAVDPPEGFLEQAELAQKRQQFQTAEQALRKSVALAPRNVSYVIALAMLLAKEGMIQESDAVFSRAEQMAPNAPKVWFARADTWLQQRRNLQQAKALLEKYVHASISASDPPRQEAYVLLRQIEQGVYNQQSC